MSDLPHVPDRSEVHLHVGADDLNTPLVTQGSDLLSLHNVIIMDSNTTPLVTSKAMFYIHRLKNEQSQILRLFEFTHSGEYVSTTDLCLFPGQNGHFDIQISDDYILVYDGWWDEGPPTDAILTYYLFTHHGHMLAVWYACSTEADSALLSPSVARMDGLTPHGLWGECLFANDFLEGDSGFRLTVWDVADVVTTISRVSPGMLRGQGQEIDLVSRRSQVYDFPGDENCVLAMAPTSDGLWINGSDYCWRVPKNLKPGSIEYFRYPSLVELNRFLQFQQKLLGMTRIFYHWPGQSNDNVYVTTASVSGNWDLGVVMSFRVAQSSLVPLAITVPVEWPSFPDSYGEPASFEIVGLIDDQAYLRVYDRVFVININTGELDSLTSVVSGGMMGNHRTGSERL